MERVPGQPDGAGELLDERLPKAASNGKVFAIHYTAERGPFFASPEGLEKDLRAVARLARKHHGAN